MSDSKVTHPPVLDSGGESLRAKAERIRSENWTETDRAKIYFAIETAQLLGCEPCDIVAHIHALRRRVAELESEIHMHKKAEPKGKGERNK